MALTVGDAFARALIKKVTQNLSSQDVGVYKSGVIYGQMPKRAVGIQISGVPAGVVPQAPPTKESQEKKPEIIEKEVLAPVVFHVPAPAQPTRVEVAPAREIVRETVETPTEGVPTTAEEVPELPEVEARPETKRISIPSIKQIVLGEEEEPFVPSEAIPSDIQPISITLGEETAPKFVPTEAPIEIKPLFLKEKKYSMPIGKVEVSGAKPKVYVSTKDGTKVITKHGIIEAKGAKIQDVTSNIVGLPPIVHKIPSKLLKKMATEWTPLNLEAINERVPLIEPFAYANIRWSADENSLRYYVIEPPLTEKQKKKLQRIKDLIIDFLNINLYELENYDKTKKYLSKKIDELVANYNIRVAKGEYEILNYYIARDLLGLERIEPLMRDENIEDISCIGVGIPIYVFHKKYGSLKTNIAYESLEILNNSLVTLAQRTSKDISVASPLLNGALPDGSRVQATYSTGADVAAKGSTFTIRKFSTDPFTVVDLINFGTLPSLIAAYLWLALEEKNSILISGGTATGKTTILASVSMFLPPNAKIISIEDTPELRLPHENWVPKVARAGSGPIDITGHRAGEITMFDLLKAAFRERPEYIVVGEVRGAEAYTLFQMMASGHPGLSTIHADSMPMLVQRLTTKPLNLSPGLIQSLDIVMFMKFSKVKGHEVRRIGSVEEVVGINPQTGKPITNELFRWNPADDTYSFVSDRSYVLDAIIKRRGISEESIWAEIQRRVNLLEWMRKTNTRYYKDVGKIVAMYYKTPESLLDKIKV